VVGVPVVITFFFLARSRARQAASLIGWEQPILPGRAWTFGCSGRRGPAWKLLPRLLFRCVSFHARVRGDVDASERPERAWRRRPGHPANQSWTVSGDHRRRPPGPECSAVDVVRPDGKLCMRRKLEAWKCHPGRHERGREGVRACVAVPGFVRRSCLDGTAAARVEHILPAGRRNRCC
jgi:hypothetical protein